MARLQLFAFVLFVGSGTVADAQHHHHGWGGNWYSQPQYWYNPNASWSGGSLGSYIHPDHRGARQHHYVIQTPVLVNPVPVVVPAIVPVTPRVVIPTVSVTPVVHPTLPDLAEDPAKRPAKPSTPAAKLKSLEHQTNGDEQLRKQAWAQAYMRYRSAIDAAGDRGEARFRQAFTYVAMQHYTSAVREFKRGLFLDSDLPANGIKLSTLFGPGSEVVRTSILHKVADWVREDPKDTDRLFLLGLMLHYEDDPRCQDVLKAAQQMAGAPADHIAALLAVDRTEIPAKPALLPELPPLPDEGALPTNLVIPDLNRFVAPGLPQLSDRAVPPVVGPVPQPRGL